MKPVSFALAAIIQKGIVYWKGVIREIEIAQFHPEYINEDWLIAQIPPHELRFLKQIAVERIRLLNTELIVTFKKYQQCKLQPNNPSTSRARMIVPQDCQPYKPQAPIYKASNSCRPLPSNPDLLSANISRHLL